MAKVSPLMIAPPVLFAGLAALFFFGMARDNPNELPSALAGRQAPELAVEPLGELPSFDSSILADGHVKLVNFWNQGLHEGGSRALDKKENVADVFSTPLYICMAGFGFLFIALVFLRTRTEIHKRRTNALLARERLG